MSHDKRWRYWSVEYLIRETMSANRFPVDRESAIPIGGRHCPVNQPAVISFSYIDLRIEARNVEYVVLMLNQLLL